MADFTKITVGSIQILEISTNPNGIVSAPLGSLAIDSTNARLYQNTNGGGAWAIRDGIQIVATFASRNLSNPRDGDTIKLTDTGSLFQYSSTIGEWVRPWVYSGSVVLDVEMGGDILPSAESPVWIHTVGGTPGTITTDGTHVLMSSIVADADTAYVEYDHGQNGANHFIMGYFIVTSESDNGGTLRRARTIVLSNGSRKAYVCLSNTVGDKTLTLTDAASTGEMGSSSLQTVAYQTESWIEIYFVNGQLLVYHNQAEQPAIEFLASGLGATAATKYQIGDLTADGGALTKCRNVKCGRF